MEQNVLLNPDHSGKALIKVSMVNPMAGLVEGLAGEVEKQAPEGTADDFNRIMSGEMAKGFASGVLAGAKGVEAWDKVKYTATPDGKFTFEGVAYFPDFNAFLLSASSINEEASDMLTSFHSERNPTGEQVIRALVDDLEGEAAAAPPQPMPAEEVDACTRRRLPPQAALQG